MFKCSCGNDKFKLKVVKLGTDNAVVLTCTACSRQETWKLMDDPILPK